MPLANTTSDVKAWLQDIGVPADGITETPVDQAPATAAPVEKPASKRHRGWVKLREHVYICPVCGTGRENCQDGKVWFTLWHLSNGTSVTLKRTPPCEVGTHTVAALRKHAAAIEAAAAEKKGAPA